MAFYRTILFYRHYEQGFTQVYYREAAGARAAAALDPAQLQRLLAVCHEDVRLEAVRAQQVDGLRPLFLGLESKLAGGAHAGPADVTSVSARLYIPFAGGEGRSLFLRGLPDAWVRRTAAGRDAPPGVLMAAIRGVDDALHTLDFRGRRKVQTHPKFDVKTYGPDAGSGERTIVTCYAPPDLAAGQLVQRGGPPLLGFDEDRGYAVLDVEGAAVTLALPWVANRAAVAGGPGHWVRRLDYTYPALGEAQFTRYTKHTTGPRYRRASWAPLRPFACPQDPCGRVMDMLRGCYTTALRPFRDNPDVLVPATWYFPPEDGRPALFYEHAFGSRVWELDTDYPPLIGERYEGRPWASGRPPVELAGQGQCGNAEQWARGALTADVPRPLNQLTGSPCCCGAGKLTAGGGVVLAVRFVLRQTLDADAGGGGAGEDLVELVPVVELDPEAAGGGGAGEDLVELVPVVELGPEGGGGGAGEDLVELGDGGGGGATTGDCLVFPAVPLTYVGTVAGALTPADRWNGEWAVPWTEGCSYQFTDDDGSYFALHFDNIGPYLICNLYNIIDGSGAFYQSAPLTSPFGAITLASVENPSGNYPATISVESV